MQLNSHNFGIVNSSRSIAGSGDRQCKSYSPVCSYADHSEHLAPLAGVDIRDNDDDFTLPWKFCKLLEYRQGKESKMK